jgi:hypothetical protein
MSPSQPPANAIPTLPSFRNMTLHEKLAHSNEASKHYAAYHVRPFVTPTYLRPVSTSGDWQTQIKPVHDAFDALLTQIHLPGEPIEKQRGTGWGVYW